MIAFDLQCAQGHTFEGWFEDNQAYEDQEQKGYITCPACNDSNVCKLPSTFAIKSGASRALSSPCQQPVNAVPEKVNPNNLNVEQMAKIGQKIADYVEKNFDDVGCDFAKEALKIHYGATEPRNIRGHSTAAEEKTLKAEGIQFFKFPTSPAPDTDS